MRKRFFEKYSRDIHQKIVGMGATFTDMAEHPERLFIEQGYTLVEMASIPLYAVDRVAIGIPAFAVRHLMRTLRDGYVIAVFHR